ncbi:STAS domain-containing protein [Salipaludibacillus aurantiacus]|uniref:Anti-sigma factor antagonist n=1 Tax=Salipaludibacillus aurantiacus TaxID=1601833 RepID=A0A1H9WSC0_9BACI|nr:STAS domain-containing protein [Salipaludibacillus aurantiacus]SES36679.1 anti-sigma B factor antagonist [Salipaludibacillus aurantiacus]
MIKTIQEQDGWVKVQLEGDIYFEEASIIREQLIKYAESGCVYFDFDFSNVTSLDSSGLGVLTAIYKRAAEHNGQVKISNPQGPVKEIFEFTKLDGLFRVEEN